MWRRAPRRSAPSGRGRRRSGRESPASRRADSSKVHSPESKVSSAGSRSSDKARRSRRAWSHRDRCAAATAPTCEARSTSRREWKAPPSGAGTVAAPYQLSSTTVASTPASRTAVASPSAVALAWNTTSASGIAAAGVANPTPRRSATARRDARTSTSSTSHPGMRPASQATRHPTAPPPTTATRLPGTSAPSHTALIAVSRLAARTARRGGTPSGTACAALAGITNRVWCGCSANTVRSGQIRWPVLHHADAGVAVLHRHPELAGLKRRAHPLVFFHRHTPVEHQRFGPAADAAVQRPHHDVVLAGRRQPLPADLAPAGRHRPECERVVSHAAPDSIS